MLWCVSALYVWCRSIICVYFFSISHISLFELFKGWKIFLKAVLILINCKAKSNWVHLMSSSRIKCCNLVMYLGIWVYLYTCLRQQSVKYTATLYLMKDDEAILLSIAFSESKFVYNNALHILCLTPSFLITVDLW